MSSNCWQRMDPKHESYFLVRDRVFNRCLNSFNLDNGQQTIETHHLYSINFIDDTCYFQQIIHRSLHTLYIYFQDIIIYIYINHSISNLPKSRFSTLQRPKHGVTQVIPGPIRIRRGFLNPFDTTVFSRGAADVQLQAAETGALMGTIIGGRKGVARVYGEMSYSGYYSYLLASTICYYSYIKYYSWI